MDLDGELTSFQITRKWTERARNEWNWLMMYPMACFDIGDLKFPVPLLHSKIRM
jgi:hypothetical protein